MWYRQKFALLTAVLFLAVGVVLFSFPDRATREQTLQLAEHQNIALCRTLASALRRDVRQLLADAQTVEPRMLQNDPRVAAFRSTLQSQLIGLPIVKVKIYDSRGITVFSTERVQIGEDKSGNAGFRRALAGGVATELTFRNQFSAFDDVIEDRDVLSSYVPIEDFAGRIDSVFEIYQDVTNLMARLRETSLTRAIMVFGSLSIAYVLLLLLRARS